MIPPTFEYDRATSLPEALSMLAKGGDTKILAGGHSLLPLMKIRLASPGRLIDIGRLDELKGYRYGSDGSLSIGALTTYAEAMEATRFGWFRDALEGIGDIQVRNRGTLGGAIAHADPAADMPAILLAVDGEVVLATSGGTRTVPADRFFHGPFETACGPDEILTELRRPAIPEGAAGAYAKLPQPASGYAIVGVAAIVGPGQGTITHARIGITGVGDVAYRAREVEDALTGSDGSDAAISAAAEHAIDGVTVRSDIHADAEYRGAMAKVYTRRAIHSALGR